MSDYKLKIKDGSGTDQELYADSGSSGLVPYHAISGSVDVNVTFPLTQSVSLVNTGSLTASLSNVSLAVLTSSISDVSSAIAHSLDKFIAGILANGSSSFNVDIVAGDVNTITGSIDGVVDEVAKLTALSGSDGLKVYTLLTSSVSIINTGSLTASVTVSNESLNVTSSLTRGNTADNALYVIPSGSTVIRSEYAGTASSGSYLYSEITASSKAFQEAAAKTLYITNQANKSLYITLNGIEPTSTNYNFVLDPYSTYESLSQNVRLQYKMILDAASTSGRVVYTTTQ